MNNYDIKCRVIEEELRFIWPEWHVVSRLGGGAFGDVFQIYKEKYGIRVDSALKVIQVSDEESTVPLLYKNPDGTEADSESQSDIPDSLHREIQIMETLRGAPNIVNIEDFYFRREGETCSLFVRMELLTSLKEVLSGKDGQHTLSSIREICKLGKDICTALMHCEKKGIIHRDIKPANLFVDEFGHYKVGDFGASKHMDTVHAAQTMTGIGTISYMAPEIFRGQSYNNTVDIYALGLVLYQLLNNGRAPFLKSEGSYTAQDIDSANYMRLHGTPVPSLEGNLVAGERIDNRLDTVIRKACAVDPADRYQTAKEFYDALILTETEVKSGAESEKKQQSIQPPESHSESQKKENRRPARKNFLIAIVPLLILVAAGLAVLLGRERFSSDENMSTVAQAEEKTGGDLAIVTSAAEDSSEIVEIPDPVLKKTIQDALEIGEREITKADALSLTSLSYDSNNSDQKIKDITGLSKFKNLEYLHLCENQISDISALSGLTNLTDLYLSENQISDVSVLSGLTNLTRLQLDSNQISDIRALVGLTNLQQLYLFENQISDISALSDLTNLDDLGLSNNKISNISALSGLKKLRSLQLGDNQIKDIRALSGLIDLTMLSLSENQISDISALSGLIKLRALYLSENQISDISALSGLINLTALELSYNQISDISALSGLTNPSSLHLEFNQISDIGALSGMTNLEYLYLYHNQINDISALSGMKNLKYLYLEQNQIDDISALSVLRNLIGLSLSGNQISDISALSGLTNLTHLYLYDNQISDISALSGLTNLEALHLNKNPVVENKSREEIMEVLSGAENLTDVDF